MENSAPLPQPLPKPAQPKLSGAKTAYILVFVLLVIAIGILLAYFTFKNESKKQNSQSSSPASSSATPKKMETQTSGTGYVTAQSGLNLRESASSGSLVILILPYGTEVNIISNEGDWDFVEANTKGFVAKDYISPTKPAGATILKTFKDKDSPFTFLYPDVYKVTFTSSNNTLSYTFSGNDSYGGFSVTTEGPFTTLGNYSLTHYNQKGQLCDVQFAASRKGCERVSLDTGTLYLVLVGNTLYKFSYLKTEGGLLTDLNNLVFSSLVFSGS